MIKFKLLFRSGLFALALVLFCACGESRNAGENSVVGRTDGEIEVLNACGIPRAASDMRLFLMEKGFDVLDVSNADQWNYEKTFIALRNPHWPGIKNLSQALGTKNIVLLEKSGKFVDASVFVGKDFQEMIYHDTAK